MKKIATIAAAMSLLALPAPSFANSSTNGQGHGLDLDNCWYSFKVMTFRIPCRAGLFRHG